MEEAPYLIIKGSHGDEVQNTLLAQDLGKPGAPIATLIERPAAVYTPVGNIGRTLYVLTDDGAPRFRGIAIDTDKPDRLQWHTVVAENDDTLDSVSLIGSEFIAGYLHDAHSVIRHYAIDGKLIGDVAPP